MFLSHNSSAFWCCIYFRCIGEGNDLFGRCEEEAREINFLYQYPFTQSIIPFLILTLIIACLDYFRLLSLPICDLFPHQRVLKLWLNSSCSPRNHITSLQMSLLLSELSLNFLIVANLVETNLILFYCAVGMLLIHLFSLSH